MSLKRSLEDSDDSDDSLSEIAGVIREEALDKPKRRKIIAGVPLNQSTIPLAWLAPSRHIFKDEVPHHVLEHMSWMPQDLQNNWITAVLDPIKRNKSSLHSLLVDHEEVEDLLMDLIEHAAIKSKSQKSQASGLYGKNGSILFQHIHFVERGQIEGETTFVIKSKDQARDFVARVEKDEDLKTLVLCIPVTVESDEKMHDFFRVLLRTLEMKVIVFYLIRDTTIMSQVFTSELEETTIEVQMQNMRMLWNDNSANFMANELLRKTSLAKISGKTTVVPPLSGIYAYLHLRLQWYHSILCHDHFKQAQVRICETALLAHVSQQVHSLKKLVRLQSDVHQYILQNLDNHVTKFGISENPVVNIQISDAYSLVMTVDGEPCNLPLISYKLKVTQEIAEQISDEMKQISQTCNEVTIEERPPGSMALHASMLMPMFTETEQASNTMLSTFRSFCYQAEPQSTVVYQNQMLIDTHSNRQMNLFGHVLTTVNKNLLYAVGRTVQEFRNRQHRIEAEQLELKEEHTELKETVKALQEEMATMRSQKDKRRKKDAGAIYKVKTSFKVQYRKPDGKFATQNITQFTKNSQGKRVKRPNQEIFQFARQLGLTDTAINRSFERLKRQGHM